MKYHEIGPGRAILKQAAGRASFRVTSNGRTRKRKTVGKMQ